jgi:peptidoglycan/LPS O-acetylase OafA/YrhL
MLWWLHDLDDLYLHGLRKGRPTVRAGLAACRLLGLMSYSLYLLHGRLQFLAQQVCRQLLSGITFDVAAIGTTCAMCTCSIAPARSLSSGRDRPGPRFKVS